MLGAWASDIQTYQGFMAKFLQSYVKGFKAAPAAEPSDATGAPPEASTK